MDKDNINGKMAGNIKEIMKMIVNMGMIFMIYNINNYKKLF